MFCGNCGNEVESGSTFCPVCGSPVEASNKKGVDRRSAAYVRRRPPARQTAGRAGTVRPKRSRCRV